MDDLERLPSRPQRGHPGTRAKSCACTLSHALSNIDPAASAATPALIGALNDESCSRAREGCRSSDAHWTTSRIQLDERGLE